MVGPDILRNGLGRVGSHAIPQNIWGEPVPAGFCGGGLDHFRVESPWVDERGRRRPGPSTWLSNEVTQLIRVLLQEGMLVELPGRPTPACSPFIIPKTSQSVSMILSCVRPNGMDGASQPRFSLQSWEGLEQLLMTFSLVSRFA